MSGGDPLHRSLRGRRRVWEYCQGQLSGSGAPFLQGVPVTEDDGEEVMLAVTDPDGGYQ